MTAKKSRYFNSHAHVERDGLLAMKKLGMLNFNSHAHVERDQEEDLDYEYQNISTHTLTWSVTS